jgi:hypothetical protein
VYLSFFVNVFPLDCHERACQTNWIRCEDRFENIPDELTKQHRCYGKTIRCRGEAIPPVRCVLGSRSDPSPSGAAFRIKKRSKPVRCCFQDQEAIQARQVLLSGSRSDPNPSKREAFQVYLQANPDFVVAWGLFEDFQTSWQILVGSR